MAHRKSDHQQAGDARRNVKQKKQPRTTRRTDPSAIMNTSKGLKKRKSPKLKGRTGKPRREG